MCGLPGRRTVLVECGDRGDHSCHRSVARVFSPGDCHRDLHFEKQTIKSGMPICKSLQHAVLAIDSLIEIARAVVVVGASSQCIVDSPTVTVVMSDYSPSYK